jgi:hypothetical protein
VDAVLVCVRGLFVMTATPALSPLALDDRLASVDARIRAPANPAITPQHRAYMSSHKT